MSWGRLLVLTAVALATSCSGHVRRRSLDLQDALGHQNDFYLPRSIVPRSYRLELVANIDQGYFTGGVWINVTCIEPSDSVTLHAHESLNTTSNHVSVRQLLPGDATSNESKNIAVSSTKKNFAKQWYIIMLRETLEKGADYELYITFSGKLTDSQSEAFFRGHYVDSRSQETSWYAATAMETTKARRVFPCFDEPAMKATFQISVAVRRKYHVWSNMPLKDTDNMAEEAGWLWHRFPATPPMSTFSVEVFISDFHYVTTMTSSGGYIRLSARPELLDHLQKVNKMSVEAFKFAEEYFNFSYPLDKLDVIVLPENSSDFSSDSWGFVMIREADVQDSSTAVTSSMLTQWIGHLTTPYWWSGIGLHAALIAHLCTQFKAQKLNMTSATSGYPLYKDYGSADSQLSAITGHQYTDRGLRLLRLLNYSLTENTFRQALHLFLEDRQYKTFTDSDLWTALTSQGRQDQTLDEDVSIEEVAKSWLGKERYPAVTVTRDYEQNTATVQQHVFLRERPHKIPGKDRMLWYIPVLFITASNMNISDMRPVAWLKNDKQVTIDNLPGEDEFIIVNPDEIGTFMVNYDATNWALLSQALLQGILPTSTRAKLLHDAWNLAYAGELDLYTALNLTLFLKQEPALQVWDSFFAMVDQLGRYLGGTEVEQMFQEYARSLVEHCLRLLGPANQNEDQDTRKLRDAAEEFQCILSQPQCNTSIEEVYTMWTESTDHYEYTRRNKVPFGSILSCGSLEQFQHVLQYTVKLQDRGHVEAAKNMFVTLARSALSQPDKAESLLSLLLLDDVPNMTSYIPRTCLAQLSRHYNGSLSVFHFVQQHWQQLRDRLESNPELWKLVMSAATARFVTQDDLDMFSEFYLERRGHFGNAELLVEKELERMKEDAEWTTNNVPEIHRWLEDFLQLSVFPLE